LQPRRKVLANQNVELVRVGLVLVVALVAHLGVGHGGEHTTTVNCRQPLKARSPVRRARSVGPKGCGLGILYVYWSVCSM
jgi:hypothetical protein